MSEITDFMLDAIDDADGDPRFYTKVVKENKEVYRTLDEYISSRMDKNELAKRLGLTTVRLIESWEIKGMKFQRALQCAIALKLDLEEANNFLSKYAGMRSLYPASKQEFRLIYVLIYREKLEKQFPYKENESVKQWMDRVFPLLEFVNKVDKIELKNIKSQKNEVKVATQTYLDILMEQNLELIPKLKFRSAGEKALAYLDELVKDTPFEKNYGNRSSGNEDITVVNDRNGSIRKDLFEEEEKGHYLQLRKKLENGDIPHRDQIIQFALGMTLNLNRENVDQLLVRSGYEPLQARNLYEGLLLSLYMAEERIENEQDEDSTYYTDYRVFVSEKIDEAIENLPEAGNLIKEIPQWYINDQERKKLMEKRCFSEMISVISEKMTRTWKLTNQKKLEKISDSTFRKAASNQIYDLGYKYYDQDNYNQVFEIICRTESKWVDIVNNGILEGMKRKDYLILFNDILSELDDYYRENYAQKKKHSVNKGTKGGKGRNDY